MCMKWVFWCIGMEMGQGMFTKVKQVCVFGYSALVGQLM